MTSEPEYPTIFKAFEAMAQKYPNKAAVVFLGTKYLLPKTAQYGRAVRGISRFCRSERA